MENEVLICLLSLLSVLIVDWSWLIHGDFVTN